MIRERLRKWLGVETPSEEELAKRVEKAIMGALSEDQNSHYKYEGLLERYFRRNLQATAEIYAEKAIKRKMERFDSEEFLDDFIARINRKQLR